jgi:hypothetical protein
MYFILKVFFFFLNKKKKKKDTRLFFKEIVFLFLNSLFLGRIGLYILDISDCMDCIKRKGNNIYYDVNVIKNVEKKFFFL